MAEEKPSLPSATLPIPQSCATLSCSGSAISENSTGRQTPADASTERTDELSEIARQMSRGVKLKDRVYMLKEYKCCFKGTDAVKWLLSSGICHSIEEAVQLGNRLREQGFIRHVTNSYIFSNKEYYYWFHESVMDPSTSYKSMLGLRGTAAADDHDLGNELIQVQRTVHAIKTDIERRLDRTQKDISKLTERMKRVEDIRRKEMEDRRWWLRTSVAVLMSMFVLSRIPYMEVIGGGTTVALLVHAVLFLMRHGGILGAVPLRGREREQGEEIVAADGLTGNDGTVVVSEERGVKASDFVDWPDAPCLLFAQPCLMFDTPRMLRMNVDVPIPFETELFKGEVMMWCDGLPSSPPDLFKVTLA